MPPGRGAGWWLAMVLCGCAAGLVQGAPGENKLVLNARQVMLPFYHGPEGRLSVVVRADRFTRENQRRAFFRIGVLPMLIVHDVSVEVRRPESLGAVSEELHRYLAGQSIKRTVELRNFSLLVKPEGRRLTAAKVRMVKPDEWELTGPVRWMTESSTNEYARAVLYTKAGQGGGLRLPDGKMVPLAKDQLPTTKEANSFMK